MYAHETFTEIETQRETMIPVTKNWKHTPLLIQAHCGRRRKLYCAVTSIILTRMDRNHK